MRIVNVMSPRRFRGVYWQLRLADLIVLRLLPRKGCGKAAINSMQVRAGRVCDGVADGGTGECSELRGQRICGIGSRC